MKTVKRIATLLICLSLCLSLGAAGFALEATDPELDLANAMHNLGLFMGVGENEDGTVNYDLDRAPTRIEALVMLIRLLGKEAEAVKLGKTHPFTDVPEWADGYVSYAVENGLTKGVSDALFDCESDVTPEMYMTFLLRALGYSDGKNGDFVWNDPYALAVMLRVETHTGNISRADAMIVSANALYANIKGGKSPLYEKLISDGAFTAEEFKNAALVDLMPIGTCLGSSFLKFDNYDSALEYCKDYTQSSSTIDATIVEMEEPDTCTFVVTTLGGIPRPFYDLMVVYKAGSPLGEGTVIHLPAAPSGMDGSGTKPDTVSFSEDGTTLVYTNTFTETNYYGDGSVRREAGTFTYTTNLLTGVTAVTYQPKALAVNDSPRYENHDLGISMEFPDSWSGRYAVDERDARIIVYTDWGGRLCSVFWRRAYDWANSGEADMIPTEYKVIGENDDYVYVLVFASDVQYDPENEEQVKTYQEMREDLYNVKFEFIGS